FRILFSFNVCLYSSFPKSVYCLIKSSFCSFICFHSSFHNSLGCLGCSLGNLSGSIFGYLYCFTYCLSCFFHSTSCTFCYMAVSDFFSCIANILCSIFCCHGSFLYRLC